MNDHKIEDLLQFIEASPTPYHAVQCATQKLQDAGFVALKEEEPWKLALGGKYYLSKNETTLAAFCLPEKWHPQCSLFAAHTDSPCLKLKPKPEFRKDNLLLLSLEPYGSPLFASWVNRDLGIAGKVSFLNEGLVQEKLVNFKSHPVFIPQLAIHLDRQVNEKGLVLNPQEELSAISAIVSHFDLSTLLQSEIERCEILNLDLFLYPLEGPRLVGFNHEFIASHRLDNLGSCHAILKMLQSNKTPSNEFKIGIFWDHEEIGSQSASGASSPFLLHLIERITIGLNLNREAFLQLLSKSVLLSIDVAHAAHPNYPSKHDPRHPNFLGQGISLKTHAQQKYASDTKLASYLRWLSKKEKIPLQEYSHRADMGAGSTIGPISSAKTGISTIDIGYPVLSMHASRELSAVDDHLSLCRLLKTFSWSNF